VEERAAGRCEEETRAKSGSCVRESLSVPIVLLVDELRTLAIVPVNIAKLPVAKIEH
jgi:hypothetical protein